MKLYEIRFYQPDDWVKFQNFINHHWRDNHIIARNKALFDFQHNIDGRYTFVVAENKQTGEFDGVYGYILTRKYDKTKTIPNVAWGAIWKVRKDVKNNEIASLGLKLLQYIIKNENIQTFAVSGISAVNKEVSLGIGFKAGVLNHYYYANGATKTYNIAKNPRVIDSYSANPEIEVRWVNINEIKDVDANQNPYKNLSYFYERYYKHPIFSYRFLGVYKNGKLVSLFVVREQYVGKDKCLRIIDAIGNFKDIGSMGFELQAILERENAEYIDCLNYGIDESIFENLGFNKVDDETIIPEYFSPFVQKNVLVEVLCMDPDEPIIIFKGDGDQDRPN